MEAAEVSGAVCAMAHTPLLANERQARELAPLVKAEGAEVAAEVLRETAEAGPVTITSTAADSNR